MFGRIQAGGIPYGSEPNALESLDINHRGGGGASTSATSTGTSLNCSPWGQAPSEYETGLHRPPVAYSCRHIGIRRDPGKEALVTSFHIFADL